MFLFLVFQKNGLNRNSLFFEDLSEHKMSWPHIDWFKFCIHPRSLNVHFGMVEDTGLKSTASRSPSMA
jgi:hypothetical protein